MAYLVISCSLKPGSRSRMLADAALARMEATGVDAELIDLRTFKLPVCDADSCYTDPNVQEIARRIADAEGVLMTVPIYNYDVNSATKNLLELTGEAWREKVVGFLCAAGGRSSYMAVMSFANSMMLDFHSIIVPRFVYAGEPDTIPGNPVDDLIRARIDDVVTALVRFARALNPTLQER